MMDKPKPVPYPNLADSMNVLADTHAAIHGAVQEHAANHVDLIAAKRKALELRHAAKRLLDTDGRRDTHATGN
jgi:hypothetical protein